MGVERVELKRAKCDRSVDLVHRPQLGIIDFNEPHIHGCHARPCLSKQVGEHSVGVKCAPWLVTVDVDASTRSLGLGDIEGKHGLVVL